MKMERYVKVMFLRFILSISLFGFCSLFFVLSAQAFPLMTTGNGPNSYSASGYYGDYGAGIWELGGVTECSTSPCQYGVTYANNHYGQDGIQSIQASGDSWTGPDYSAAASGYADAATGQIGAQASTAVTSSNGTNLDIYSISDFYNTYTLESYSNTSPDIKINWSLDGKFSNAGTASGGGYAELVVNVGMFPALGDYTYPYGALAYYYTPIDQAASSYYYSDYSNSGSADITSTLNWMTNRLYGRDFTIGDSFLLDAKLYAWSASPTTMQDGSVLLNNDADFIHTASIGLDSSTGTTFSSAAVPASTPTPEPSTIFLMIPGLAGLFAARKRKVV